MMEPRNVHVYDVEGFPNLFMLSAEHVDNEHDCRTFIIWEDTNDLIPMLQWLKSKDLKQIGFNNMKFDYQIIHWILANEQKLLKMRAPQVALEIYWFMQELVQMQFPPIAPYRVCIPQRDVYLIHHFDNKHKAVSLKALQIAMKWPNVMDTPYDFRKNVETIHQVMDIKEYNINDVKSTKFFYWKSIDLINLRLALTDKYGIDLRNANQAKIGQEIILDKVARKLGLNVRDIRQMRTERPHVNINECILPYIVEMLEPPFDEAFIRFCNMVVTNSDNEEDDKKYGFSILYDDMQYDFGIGGLHAVRAPGVYSSDTSRTIKSADGTSYYPNLSLENQFAPEHFGAGFLSAYKEVYEERKLYKKGTPENYALKIALNGAYGKSRDKYSPLYDPKFTMQITVNGQLLLAALAQMVTKAGARVIMVNTDGIEMFVTPDVEDAVQQAMNAWSVKTRIPLEYKNYSKLFIRDVNNYIGLYPDGTTYNKGAYEWREYDEKGTKLLEWHKDHSMLAVPFAVENFLVRGIPLQQSFEQADFKQFYIGKRSKTDGKFQIRYVEDSEIRKVQLNKTVRYIIGKKGGYLYRTPEEGDIVMPVTTGKKGKKGKAPWAKVDAPWKVILCMREPEPEVKENIDYRYYMREAVKLIHPILNTQENMYQTINPEENGLQGDAEIVE